MSAGTCGKGWTGVPERCLRAKRGGSSPRRDRIKKLAWNLGARIRAIPGKKKMLAKAVSPLVTKAAGALYPGEKGARGYKKAIALTGKGLDFVESNPRIRALLKAKGGPKVKKQHIATARKVLGAISELHPIN